MYLNQIRDWTHLLPSRVSDGNVLIRTGSWYTREVRLVGTKVWLGRYNFLGHTGQKDYLEGIT